YRAWRTQVQHDTFDDELGSHNRLPDSVVTRTGGDNQDSSGDLFSIDALFLRAVVGPSAVFPTSRDYFRNVVTNTNPGRNAVLVGALRTVITALTTQYGTTDPTQWLTPKITVEVDETSASSILYGPTIISAGPGHDERGDRADARAGEPAIAFPEPPHLRDQVALYESFQYHSLPFAQAELEVARALARDGVAPQSRRDVRR